MLEFLRAVIGYLRSKLFELLTGLDYKAVHVALLSNKEILQRLDEYDIVLDSLLRAMTKIAQNSGGEGWNETVQNAIMNLSQRIEALGEIMMEHQLLFQEISANQIDDEDSTFNKKQIN